MKFYKGCESLSFFISTYVVFCLHILLIYSVDDKSCEELDEINTTLIIHKEIILVLFLFTFCSHLIASFSDPGSIETQNNLEALESYNFIYKEINQIKNKINQAKRQDDSDSSNTNDSSSFQLSSEEDNDLPLNDENNISLKKQKIISEKYDFEINKCMSCKVLRPKATHHCSDCHCCILDRENHCPWMNNCVGLFNRKSYLLFCMYSVISVVYSFKPLTLISWSKCPQLPTNAPSFISRRCSTPTTCLSPVTAIKMSPSFAASAIGITL